ncbi:MAG TPA: ORF6N domain-containing protein, partial [bacterium]|nr:ORF6N domain-containing protein [bacterium]
MPKKISPSIIPVLHEIRERRVILDQDLAALYEVSNKVLLQAVRRNPERFPSDFVFRLENKEFLNLRPQFEAASLWGGRRDAPLAFTEEGVAMLSGLLNSPRAIAVNVAIMREFVRLRNLAGLRDYAARKLQALEQRVDLHDQHFERAFEAIERMMAVPERPKRRIGFGGDDDDGR